MPLEGPRNRGVSSFSSNRTSPPGRMASSGFGGAISSSVYCARVASNARTLSWSRITYVRDIFLPFAVSWYSHWAPARSHGMHLGRVGSHRVFLYIEVSQLFGDGAIQWCKPDDICSKLLEYGRSLEKDLHSHGYFLELAVSEPVWLCKQNRGLAGRPLLDPSTYG